MTRFRTTLALLLPQTHTSLRRAFVEDRWLLWATACLLVCAWIPLFLSPFLPFCDAPLNAASAELLWDAAWGNLPIAAHHRIYWAPVPYWTGYLLACLLGKIFGALVTVKWMTALVIALLPLSTMRLLLALRHDPRLGLWAFVLVWQQNLYAGWLELLLGLGLVGFVLAWLLEARTLSDGLRLAPWTAVIALTHIQATWLLGVAAIALCFAGPAVRSRLRVHATAGLGAIVVVSVWLASQLRLTRPNSQSSGAFAFTWHSATEKLAKFYGYTLDNFARPDAARAASIAFWVIVLGSLLLWLLPRKASANRRSPIALLVSPTLLYALLWWEVRGPIAHWYTYPRYAVVTVLWLLLLPAPGLRGRAAFALAPGILAALWLDFEVATQFVAFGRQTRPYLEIIEAVPPNASVLPLVLDDDDSDPDLKVPPYHQFYAYLTAVRHAESPYLWSSSSNPVRYWGTRLPAPSWEGHFSMKEHGSEYDYLLVQGFEKHGDPVKLDRSSSKAKPRLVLQSGRWRLYAVH